MWADRGELANAALVRTLFERGALRTTRIAEAFRRVPRHRFLPEVPLDIVYADQAIALRHELTDFLLNAAGHIGYGIRPSARRRGLATWALQAILVQARGLGLTKVLVTCDDANVASAGTIEKVGGVLEDVRDTELGRTRRYWITL